MVSLALLKKWKRMLFKKSVLHMDQGIGMYYTHDELSGYYNDLRGKALYSKHFDDFGIPIHTAVNGGRKKSIYFPIAIFQYGLGCYDQYLETGDAIWKEKMLDMAKWTQENQKPDGSFDAFGCLDYSCIVSSMAQGEACSLFARAYKETEDEKFLKACIKAADFMLLDRNKGGTASCTEDGVFLYEYPDQPLVLNGWIFSAFGLLDCFKITKEPRYEASWLKTLHTIKKNLQRFDGRFWSMYETGGSFASPFYHRLHISLLSVLDDMDPSPEYRFYIDKWNRNAKHTFCKKYAFCRKAIQKIFESRKSGWIIVE